MFVSPRFLRPLARRAALLATLVCAAACRSERGEPEARVTLEAAPPGPASAEVTYDEEGTPLGLHNFLRWSEHVAQGGGPEGEEAFANLARLGYRTVLSVDGARPDVETAAAHGLRYVHVPFGYDGISAEDQKKLVAAVERSDGPVYVHCHHGKHRGPAAAQIARIVLDGIDVEEAVESLRVSGCSPDYPGLYASVETFRAPTPEAVAAVGPLPAAVVPEGLRGIMAHIDVRWDFVKASAGAGWGVPAQFPDIDPAHEVGMIENDLRDVLRLERSQQARAEFLVQAERAHRAAQELEAALRARDAEAAGTAYGRLSEACKACHVTYRN